MSRIMELADAYVGAMVMPDGIHTVNDPVKVRAALAAEVEKLEAELMEQARLNGMGGDRELKLMAENERYRAALEMVAGKRLCLDPLMSNAEIAKAVLGETK